MTSLLGFIKKELHRHPFDYLLLIAAGVLFLFGLYSFKGQPAAEIIILLIFIAFYIIWGIYHHILEGSLHLKNVVEYIIIGFTVFFLIKIIISP